jgi:hypothetical protein
MEIKARLIKPYDESQRIDFIIRQNHQLGREIVETETELQAWGCTDEELLQIAKDSKYNEALEEANIFLNTEATFELTEDFHVEATKENMTCLASAAMAINMGLIPYQEWTSKEDNVLQLSADQCFALSMGISAVQTSVWTVQFIDYKNRIEEASTVEEVNSIIVEYRNLENNDNL